MATVDELQIAKHLLTLGVCKKCSLRMVNTVSNELINFANIDDEYLLLESAGHKAKKAKMGKPKPCIVCLDCLSDEVREKLFDDNIISQIRKYDNDTFMICYTVPDCITIRETCIVRYLSSKFPNYNLGKGLSYKVNRISQALRISMQNKLERLLRKKYDLNSTLQLSVSFSYDDEILELSDMVRIAKPDKLGKYVLTKRDICKILIQVPDNIWKRIFPIPAVMPRFAVEYDDVEVAQQAIYVAGRFLKFCKKIPFGWNIPKHELPSSGSIMALIRSYFSSYFSVAEDQVNVVSSKVFLEEFRILGTGMPFYMKIEDPKVTKISPADFKVIEKECNEINLDNGFIVRDLQFTDKSAGQQIHFYNQCVPKQTVIICTVEDPAHLDYVVSNLNNKRKVQFTQYREITDNACNKMPYWSEKCIYEMTAWKAQGSTFVLEILFSPGSCLHEFTDNRTEPSLSDIAGASVIVEYVDILENYEKWPPMLDNDKPCNNSVKCKVEPQDESTHQEFSEVGDVDFHNSSLPVNVKIEICD